jgi:hypothetical protein
LSIILTTVNFLTSSQVTDEDERKPLPLGMGATRSPEMSSDTQGLAAKSTQGMANIPICTLTT